MIIVSIIGLVLYLHDGIIVENGLYQGAIKAERLQYDKHSEQDHDILLNDIAEYIDEKTILIRDIKVVSNMNRDGDTVMECRADVCGMYYFSQVNVMNKDVKVAGNYPPDFIRKINALRKER